MNAQRLMTVYVEGHQWTEELSNVQNHLLCVSDTLHFGWKVRCARVKYIWYEQGTSRMSQVYHARARHVSHLFALPGMQRACEDRCARVRYVSHMLGAFRGRCTCRETDRGTIVAQSAKTTSCMYQVINAYHFSSYQRARFVRRV